MNQSANLRNKADKVDLFPPCLLHPHSNRGKHCYYYFYPLFLKRVFTIKHVSLDHMPFSFTSLQLCLSTPLGVQAQFCPTLCNPMNCKPSRNSYLRIQASLSMGFPRQDSWSGLPFHPPGDLPDPEIGFHILIVRQNLHYLSHLENL